MNQRLPKKVVESWGWVKHVGADLAREHFREAPPGTGHAICEGDWCEIHYDKINALSDPFEHLRVDAPGWWVVTTAGTGEILGRLSGAKKGEGALLGLLFGIFTAERK